MNEELFEPLDNDKFRNYFEAVSAGTCGPTVIAVMTKRPVAEILASWFTPAKKKFLDATNFKGYAPLKEMIVELERYGFKVIRRRGNKSKEFPNPMTDLAVVRIQWLKDDGKEFFWAEATKHSHYVLMKKLGGVWWVYCNGKGWFEKDSKKRKKYLKRGYVSSYLEIPNERQYWREFEKLHNHGRLV